MAAMRERLAMWLIPWAGYLYMRLVRATSRIEFRGADALDRARASSGQFILSFWHSRFPMMQYVYPDGKMAVLVSQHRDAQLIGRLLALHGHTIIHGSSTRGGMAAMRALLRAVRDGSDLSITPDGPKGPRRRAKSGVVTAAKLSGLAVVPVTFSARQALRLRSWDQTLVPRPFCSGLFLYGDPIHVPRDLDADGEEAYRLRIEEALDRLTDEADRETGIGPESPRDPPESAP